MNVQALIEKHELSGDSCLKITILQREKRKIDGVFFVGKVEQNGGGVFFYNKKEK